MKKALVYLILCCTALPAGAQTLTLDECRAAAAEHNRTLRDGRFELEAALQTRREALTGYFPQVSATGGVFQAQHGLVQADFGMTIPQLGTMNLPLSMVKRGIVGGITAVQPVFAGLKIVNGNKLARLGEEVGRLQLQKTESEVREQTDAYYWQVVSLRDNLSTIEAVERQLEEIHRQVELSVKAGLVTTNDLLRVELRQQEIASNRLTWRRRSSASPRRPRRSTCRSRRRWTTGPSTGSPRRMSRLRSTGSAWSAANACRRWASGPATSTTT